jgi:hypothetical protein
MTGVLIREWRKVIWTQREKGHVNTQKEIRVMSIITRSLQNWKRQGRIFSRVSGESMNLPISSLYFCLTSP